MMKKIYFPFAVLLLVGLGTGFLAGVLYSGYVPVKSRNTGMLKDTFGKAPLEGDIGSWNTGTLKATFREARLEGDIGRQSPVLLYQLENKTNEDYSIRDISDIQMFVLNHGKLDNFMGSALCIDLPLFVPAKQRVDVAIHFKFIELAQPAGTSQAATQYFLRDKKRFWYNYSDIVLRDKRHWCEIDFPMIQ